MRGVHTLGENSAQAVVEMAVVAPVLLILALITYNLMVFTAAVARFDRLAPDVVIARAASPATSGGSISAAALCEEVGAALQDAMDGYDVEVEVVCEDGGDASGSMLSLVGALRTFTCRMRMAPWPTRLTIAGVDLGAPVELAHERAVTIDPWRSGVVS